MNIKKLLAVVMAAVLTVLAISVAASATSYAVIWYENKVKHESGAESAEIIDGEFAAEFSAQGNDGYYANLYTYNDEYLCSVVIEDGKAVFSDSGLGSYKLVIDKVSHEDEVPYGDETSDVSSTAGIIAESEIIF